MGSMLNILRQVKATGQKPNWFDIAFKTMGSLGNITQGIGGIGNDLSKSPETPEEAPQAMNPYQQFMSAVHAASVGPSAATGGLMGGPLAATMGAANTLVQSPFLNALLSRYGIGGR